jgi:Gpi18-like mannosyltransferase
MAAAAVLVAASARLFFVEHVTPDMKGHFLPWYQQLAADGGFPGLRRSFSVYPPPYFYLLALMTYVGDAIPPIAAIKSISWAFELFTAAVMYRLVRLRHGAGGPAKLAAACVLAAPTVVINNAYWGQCDVIYTSLLLACVYLLVRQRPVAAMLCFSLAFSVKLQSVFLAPLLFGLVLRRQIAWKCVVLPIVVYVALVLPCALLGRPWSELLGFYLQQVGYFSRFLTLYAPSMFALWPPGSDPSLAWVGIVAAAVFGLCIALGVFVSRRPLDSLSLIEGAVLSVASMPFLLPRMHDRYFFPADVMSIALAFYKPRLWLVPIAFQITSLAAYAPYLFGYIVLSLRVAAGINLLVIVVLFWSWLHDLRRDDSTVRSSA